MTGTQSLTIEQFRAIANIVERAAGYGFGSPHDGTGESTPHLNRGDVVNVVIHQGLDSQTIGCKRVQINRCMASPITFSVHRDGSHGDVILTPSA